MTSYPSSKLRGAIRRAMDSLPDCVLFQILSLLDDSADVARCRVASKAFDTLFPYLRSINLVCTWKWYYASNPSTPHPRIKPFQTVFLDLISKLEPVESVSISLEDQYIDSFTLSNDDFYVTDDDFVKQWLPRVSGPLKSLTISDRQDHRTTNLLPLISKYCHNLVNLSLERACLSTHDMSPMPMLTSLTLDLVTLDDNVLNELNNCLPNLQALNLVGVGGLENFVIHHLHLKTCVWKGFIYFFVKSLTLITPSLITLTIECDISVPIHIEAPMLSQFSLVTYNPKDIFSVTRFDNLKALSLDIGPFISRIPVTKTVETLTLGSKDNILRPGSKLTLRKVFTAFPNVTCLNIHSRPWLDLEAVLNTQGREVLDGGKGLKTICAYLKLVDPLLTFSSVACVLDQCVGLSKVSFLIHSKVVGTVSEAFTYRCMNHWPGLKWRWGIWSQDMKDCWITDVGSSCKKRHLC